MMKQILLVCLVVVANTAAFAPKYQAPRKTALNLATMPPPPPPSTTFTSSAALQQPQLTSQRLQNGVQAYLDANNVQSSSVTLSLQERRPPTPEEIAAKKRNFNLWLWGGGFVAPFLATFYYFGFKFWEK